MQKSLLGHEAPMSFDPGRPLRLLLNDDEHRAIGAYASECEIKPEEWATEIVRCALADRRAGGEGCYLRRLERDNAALRGRVAEMTRAMMGVKVESKQ